VSFSTIYISADVITCFLKTSGLRFVNKIIADSQLNERFTLLENALNTKCFVSIEKSLSSFINGLAKHVVAGVEGYHTIQFGRFAEINEFIESNVEAKISLSDMARIANLNKFSFIKRFKQSSGLTPSQYVLMKKVFSSKANFFKYDSFSDIAYAYHFTDLAHWSNSFKKYIGITPTEFKKIYGS
jgi:AraC-like DNA-binding protein